MCEPISTTTAILGATALAGLGTSIYGSAQSASAAKDAAAATARSNQQMREAQNTAFTQRMAATGRQTDAQRASMQQTIADRNAAAALMRQEQGRAIDASKQNLEQENRLAEGYRREGDTAAQTLLTDTDAQAQAKMQAQREAGQNLLLDQNMPVTGPGPGATDPTEGLTTSTKTALARRGAEAATNIRDYGAKFARVAAYGAPMFGVGQEITENKFGIMPATAADALLRSGAPTRALPSQIAFRSAAGEGGAMDELIRARGQSQLDTAGLQYGNETSLANLGQSDTYTTAKNTADQAKADAAYKQQIAGIYSQLGNAAIQGAGYFGLFNGLGSGGTTASGLAQQGIAQPGSFSYRGL
jgi:hypothetical protein